jgi:hypothetical protein
MSDAFDADGHCRRYPPTVTHEYGAEFPAVARDEWCGEFQDGKKEEFDPPEIIDL